MRLKANKPVISRFFKDSSVLYVFIYNRHLLPHKHDTGAYDDKKWRKSASTHCLFWILFGPSQSGDRPTEATLTSVYGKAINDSCCACSVASFSKMQGRLKTTKVSKSYRKKLAGLRNRKSLYAIIASVKVLIGYHCMHRA